MAIGSYTFKKIAKDAMRGHWGTCIWTGLLAVLLGAFALSVGALCSYIVVTAVLLSLFEYLPVTICFLAGSACVIALFYFFVGGVIRIGYIDFNLALLDRRKTGPTALTAHGAMWWNMVLAKIELFLSVTLMSLLLVVPGIVTWFSYAMVPYIIEEKPDFSVSEAFRTSRKIMRGHKWQLFCLRLSFLGWDLVGFLTLGIGFLFISPYKNAAEAAFYNEISGRADALYARR